MTGRTFLGRYEVVRLLGEGGMGQVYLAKQSDLNRQVVVKVMNEQVAADPKFRDRFERETLLMAKFQHPYVVTLYDASLNDPLGPCIVMEYVRGVTLEEVLAKNGRFAPARVGRILGQVCEALQAAHELAIIHRDLKPANIMVIDADSPRERIKVMDFGLAKMIDDEAPEYKKVTETHVDFAVGTPGYISPEQVRGEPFDHRADIYSAGVLAFELLTGQLPFNGASPMDVVLAHANEQPPSFASLGLADLVPPMVEEVVMAALAKQPDHRPQTARDLAELFDLALVRAAEEAGTNVDDKVEIRTGSSVCTKPFADPFHSPPDDPHSLQFDLEAWMPKKIALIKLRGFVEDNHGEVLESVPGLIRVKFTPPPGVARSSSGPLSWLGLGRKLPPVLLDLHMTNPNGRDNKLQVQARFRSGDGKLPNDPVWRGVCMQRFIDLRGYLIGASERE